MSRAPTWTADMDADMNALLDGGKTMRQVAEYLTAKYGRPFTKNGVIGRRFRTTPHELRQKRRPKVDLFGKSLDELESRDCRFPFGDEAPYRFCGKRVKSGSSYCEYHHSITWKPAEKPNPATAFKAGRPRHMEKAA